MNAAAVVVRGVHDVYTVAQQAPFAYGRTSVCYRAQCPTGPDVCLKVFTAVPDLAENGGRDDAFVAEISARARLQHPNILRVLDFGKASFGNLAERYFVVLPLCEGDLRALLRQQHFTPPGKALQILRQIAAAVDHAHAEGVIHGDIKPENILFVAQGSHALLSDFGLSRFFAFHEAVLTNRPGGGGSSAYLSPEQLQDGIQTPRSDIYSLGVVTYELFVGALPFNPHDPPYRQMASKVNGELRDPNSLNPQISTPVAESILCGLNKKPADRPKSASEYCEGIARAIDGRETSQIRPDGDEQSAPTSKASENPDISAQSGRTWPDVVLYILKRPLLWALLLVILILVLALDYWQTPPGSPVTFLGITLVTKGDSPSSEVAGITKLFEGNLPAGKDCPKDFTGMPTGSAIEKVMQGYTPARAVRFVPGEVSLTKDHRLLDGAYLGAAGKQFVVVADFDELKCERVRKALGRVGLNENLRSVTAIIFDTEANPGTGIRPASYRGFFKSIRDLPSDPKLRGRYLAGIDATVLDDIDNKHGPEMYQWSRWGALWSGYKKQFEKLTKDPQFAIDFTHVDSSDYDGRGITRDSSGKGSPVLLSDFGEEITDYGAMIFLVRNTAVASLTRVRVIRFDLSGYDPVLPDIP